MARQYTQRFTVTHESGFCDGHFPGCPIVPAAVQLMWLTDFARDEGLWTEGYQVRDLKLLKELSPETAVCVELTESPRGWQGCVRTEEGAIFSRCCLNFKPTKA